ncbi:MAG TPA: tannase/feruloyl esterase family alpha/beta hydrolase [Caulobacteraceae bacterium]|nr:tannase/feruloyl esterase family alpha/beta hydrolase [Caulobacteraceae bacterium]
MSKSPVSGNKRRYSLNAYVVGGLSALALAAPLAVHAATPVVSCESLASMVLPQATITKAEAVAAGAFQSPRQGMGFNSGMDLAGHHEAGSNPAFCRITATLKPSADSDIRIEVWLPRDSWNGKFLGVASFGWGGSIQYPNLLSGLEEGYAVANTDTGHQEGNGKFALGHPEKLIDYAYRADHQLTLKAKALIKAYYGKAPSKSYWVGCSLGGLEALIEAKRYPTDYDGIVAGAPPNPIVNFNASQLWPNWLITQEPDRLMPKEKYQMIHAAMVKACGTAIGQQFNYVDQPDKCTLEPGALMCANGADSPDCLTPPQAYLLEKIYQGPVNPRTHELIYQGPAKGSELEWTPFVGTEPMSVAEDMFRYPAFQDPSFDSRQMNWDKDIETAIKKVGPLMSVDADLKPFFAHGGKLLLYIGWNDFHNPDDLIRYYQRLIKTAGPQTSKQVRLFTIPGMGHCTGGQGCDTFSKVGVIDDWVAGGKEPERIDAVKVVQGKVIRSSPLCAYPMVANYKGQGDTADAANFTCVAG